MSVKSSPEWINCGWGSRMECPAPDAGIPRAGVLSSLPPEMWAEEPQTRHSSAACCQDFPIGWTDFWKPWEKLNLFFKLLPVQHLVMVTEKAVDARGDQEGIHRGCTGGPMRRLWTPSGMHPTHSCALLQTPPLNRKSDSIWEINSSFSVLSYSFPIILQKWTLWWDIEVTKNIFKKCIKKVVRP